LNINAQTKGQVRIGIVGCGHWGIKWIELFNGAGAYVKACCDIDEQRLKILAEKAPYLDLFKEYQKVLHNKDIDAVYIATPPPTHYEIAKEALLAKKHVLVEKPMTTRYKQGLELIKLAKEMNCVLMVGNTFIYNKAIQKVKDLISEIGSLRYIHIWMTDSVDMWEGKLIYNYANVLWDLGPHPISILHYLVGEEPMAVSATCFSLLPGETTHRLYDQVIVNLYFPQGVSATLYLNWLDYSRNRRIFISGEEGVLNCGDFTSRGKVGVGLEKFSLSKGWLKARQSEVYEIDVSETLEEECKHYLLCTENGWNPITDGEAGAAVVKVLEAAQRSLQRRNN